MTEQASKITRERLMALLEAASYEAEHFIDTTQLRLAKERVAIFTLALQAEAMQPRPETYAEWQQKRGLLADKVDWAISEYNQYIMERHHNAWRVLERIIEGLRQARAMSFSEPRT